MIHRTRLIVTAIAFTAVAASGLTGGPLTATAADDSSSVAKDTDGDGLLDSATTSAAAAGAEEAGKPVEDRSQRGETATTVANADGTFTVRDYAAAIRVKDKDGNWADVDYTLEKKSDGTYGPKAALGDVSIGGGGSGDAASVKFADGTGVAVTWPEDLPEPTISKGTATYKVSDSADLLVSVTGSGLATRIRLNEAPKSDDPALTLGLETTELNIDQPSDDKLEFEKTTGKRLGTVSSMAAWDSRRDEFGDPVEVVPVEASLEKTDTTGSTVTHDMELSVPGGFLEDADTKYPVMIDPDISAVSLTQDTWVRSGTSTVDTLPYRLLVGRIASHSSTMPAHSYIQWSNTELADKNITAATMNLYQYAAGSCSAKSMNIHPLENTWSENTTTWYANKPNGMTDTGTSTSLTEMRGGDGCAANGYVSTSIRGMAQAWANGPANGGFANTGVQLNVPSANGTDVSYERRFCSSEPDSTASSCNIATRTPYLSVTYFVAGDGAFTATTPTKIIDTETGLGGSSSAFSSGQTRTYQITGTAGVPATGVTAVMLNLAGTSSGNASLYGYADGASRQESVLTYASDGRPTSNTAIVPVGANGKIALYNSAGNTHVNVDVQGYFWNAGESTTAQGYMPIVPTPLVRTDTGLGLPQAKIAAGSTQTVQVTGNAEIPTHATAVFANVRVINVNVNGGLRIGASDADLSSAPYSVNYAANNNTDTGLVIQLGPDGKVKIDSPTNGSSLDLLIDVQGYFSSDVTGASYSSLANTKIFDTRDTNILAAGEAREVQVAGMGGVPSEGEASAVAMTVSVSGWATSGTVAVYDPDNGANGTSNISFTMPATTGVSATSILSPSLDTGTIVIKNNTSGPAHIILSAQGWFGWHASTTADVAGEEPAVDTSEDPTIQQVLELQPGSTEEEVVETVETIAEDPDITRADAAEGVLSEAQASADDNAVTISASGGGTYRLTRLARRGGDVLYSPATSVAVRHGHSAIFTSKKTLAEAPGKDQRVRNINYVDRVFNVQKNARLEEVVTGSGAQLSSAKRKDAAKWAVSRAGKTKNTGDKYNSNFTKNTTIVSGKVGSDGSKQNCSQLVWAAFKGKAGIDFNTIESNSYTKRTADKLAVYPGEIRDSQYTLTYDLIETKQDATDGD